MRIQSVQLRNYRIHQELEVELDPARTLIGGPNESGKSTFAEAIYHALFLRSRKGGQLQSALVSRAGGHPEVELRFETGGKQYHLRKLFQGPRGTTALVEEGGGSWNGDEAEEKLHALCGIDPSQAGGLKPTDHWAHLWVWQGAAGEDPTSLATARQTELVTRLQKAPGAEAVMQSALDAQVASHFAEEKEALFTTRGPKAGSPLDEALRERDAAQKAFDAARSAFDSVESARADFLEAQAAIARIEAQLPDARTQQGETRRRLDELAKLRDQLRSQKERSEEAGTTLAELRKQHAEALRIEKEIARKTAELAPMEESLALLRRKAVSSEERRDAARRALQECEAATAALRERGSLAQAAVQLLALREQTAELSRRVERDRERTTQLGGLRRELAALPAIDAAGLKALQRLERTAHDARTRLETIAAELTVLASPGAVRLGDASLAAGESRTLTEPAELEVGGARIRIDPGGGTSLTEAREALREADRLLRAGLLERNLEGIDAAAEALARREYLTREINRLETELAEAEDNLRSHQETTGKRTALEEQLQHSLDDFRIPDTPEEAGALRDRCEEELKTAVARENEARQQRDAAEGESERDRKEISGKEAAQAGLRQQLAGLRGAFEQMTRQAGDEAERTRRIEAQEGRHQAETTKFEELERAISSMDPDTLEADAKRHDRAIEQSEQALQQARDQRSRAIGRLHLSGATDPEAECQSARLRLAQAEENLAVEERRAEAVRLLDSLFREEQQKLSERFTRPLADKVGDYLQCLFGPGTRIDVALRDGAFESLELTRGDQSRFAFEELSGGTREQVAVAFRLAMAEVLAEEHHGSLPIVLDDAFANADPDRIQALQRMLDLAARHGLQIIILSCTPSDYFSLGAKTVLFRSAGPASGLA